MPHLFERSVVVHRVIKTTKLLRDIAGELQGPLSGGLLHDKGEVVLGGRIIAEFSVDVDRFKKHRGVRVIAGSHAIEHSQSFAGLSQVLDAGSELHPSDRVVRILMQDLFPNSASGSPLLARHKATSFQEKFKEKLMRTGGCA
jgi:hypothetical protein